MNPRKVKIKIARNISVVPVEPCGRNDWHVQGDGITADYWESITYLLKYVTGKYFIDAAGVENMRYYQCDKYPIEFVLSENIDKHFVSHNHVGHYVISVVMQGTVTVCLENREVVCCRGDVFIIPPYAVHSVREVYRLRDSGQKEIDAGIKILADKIAGHPEQELPIETLAADIFVSKYYLIRKFRNSVGMTPHQFRIQNRIRKSQGLLDEEKTISRIAAEMGFYDQSHFDRAFQRIVGISPSEYVRSKKQIGKGT